MSVISDYILQCTVLRRCNSAWSAFPQVFPLPRDWLQRWPSHTCWRLMMALCVWMMSMEVGHWPAKPVHPDGKCQVMCEIYLHCYAFNKLEGKWGELIFIDGRVFIKCSLCFSNRNKPIFQQSCCRSWPQCVIRWLHTAWHSEECSQAKYKGVSFLIVCVHSDAGSNWRDNYDLVVHRPSLVLITMVAK